MASLNLDLDYFEHPKVKRLIGLLGKGAEMLPLKLWAFTGKFHAETGILDYSAPEIEAIIGFEGPAGACVEALLRVRFLEQIPSGYQIHEWVDHAGHIHAYKVKGKAMIKARWDKARRAAASNTSSDTASISQSDSACPTAGDTFALRSGALHSGAGEPPTETAARLKWSLERKVARQTPLPWGSPAQEESARDTLIQLATEHGEAGAAERLVAAYRWREEGKSYRTPASMPDLLFRMSKSEEAAPPARPARELPPTVEVPDDFPG